MKSAMQSNNSVDTSAKAETSPPHPRQLEEPIAIVGMACRFPQSPTLLDFWRLLEAGKTAVIQGEPGSGVGRIGQLFPDAEVQNEACLYGAYLDEIDQFDAEFFRISPVEAQLLDPQQRLMLETSWRALEDAGIDPESLRGSPTGVYAGISNMEYRDLVLGSGDTAEPATSLYSVSGTSFNTAIGRVCFALGFQGPAIALDTACSSSLVAIHQAIVGLQRREADLALAGGVHTILSGRLLELRGNAGMLAPDGQCKTFDAAANGYVRGEGCGIIVLKRLSDAEADGDRIWGVIRGSAINQDGASPGLTVPNGAAQEQVIADALSRAGVLPSQVDYVEAHGTGTPVGDPIEVQATGTAYSENREPERPLLIGSVKTNLGHLESAAGVAGVIKVVLAMHQGVIPKHRNFRTPNAEIDWDRLPLQVTSETMQWPRHPDRLPLAGVSGFGWSGTNAHVILEGYEASDSASGAGKAPSWPTGAPYPIAVALPEDVPEPARAEGLSARPTRLLPLSGKSDQALKDAAGRYLAWLDAHGEELADEDSAVDSLLSDMAWTASVGRSHFPHRAALRFQDAVSLREQLQGLLEAPAASETTASRKVALAFTGQGSQWVGMGATLYENEPVFRAVLDQCEAVFQQERGDSLLDTMFGRPEATGDLNNTAWAQPAIYALECALTAMWASVGIRPSVVVGHSLGEFAAAQAAGVFSLQAGMRFVTRRGASLESLSGAGAMAAIFAPEPDVMAAIRAVNASSNDLDVSIAAYNGAHQVVSGPVPGVEAIMGRFESQDVRVRRLNTSQAFHSVLIEPALQDVESALNDVAISTPSIKLVSNVTGQVIGSGEDLDGDYWRRHMRQPVAFNQGIKTLANLGVDVVVEVGPHAVLGPMATLAWPEPSNGRTDNTPLVVASLRRPPRESTTTEPESSFVDAVAKAYETGLSLSLEGLFAGESRRRISLPDYPFQRRRHWVDAPSRRRSSADHPLLGSRHESPLGEVSFETEISAADPAWLDDHQVYGRHVVPAALCGAMAVSAAWTEDGGPVVVEEFQLHNPIVLPEQDPEEDSQPESRRVQLVLGAPEVGSSRRVEVYSKGDKEDSWTLHVECQVSTGAKQTGETVSLDGLRQGLAVQDLQSFYRARAEVNVTLGPQFRTLQSLWTGEREAIGEIALQESADLSGIETHPIVLDGCFQVMAAARQQANAEGGEAYLPFGWERMWLTEPLPERLVCHARLRESARDTVSDDNSSDTPEVLSGDLRLYTQEGNEIGGLDGYTVKRATRAALLSATEEVADLLYEVIWRDRPLPPGMPSAEFLIRPAAIAAQSDTFSQYLSAEGVAPDDRDALLTDLEHLSWSYARVTLEQLGWQRQVGEIIEPETLRRELDVLDEHRRLFRRLLEMQARAGVLQESGGDFTVIAGPEDALPDEVPPNPDAFAAQMELEYEHGSNEIGLFRRSAGALADVLRGAADPLTLLFSSGEPSAADLYRKAPVARAANKMLGDAIAALLRSVPSERRLRVLEIGAGTGSATAAVLPELPDGRFDYVYTDISAGFFAEAEERFGGAEASIEYRVLDIEEDPITQGFNAHGYDLVIASNVLHATRYLQETLGHCRELLAPCGQLVALENLRGQGWLDLTFGQLDGWWRFADEYRPHHALASPAVWRQALHDAGFREVEVLGVDTSDSTRMPDRGVIVAQGPEQVLESAGTWVLAADRGGTAENLAAALAARNQTVVLVNGDAAKSTASAQEDSSILRASIESMRREPWRELLAALPKDIPLSGIVHLTALDGHGPDAAAAELSEDVRSAGASALALVQGMGDADVTPENGTWFITRGGQVLAKERLGQLSGALLWGLGKVVAREAGDLQSRMLDLEPEQETPLSELVNELLYPDNEDHIAYRSGLRQAARLVRIGAETNRLTLPEGSHWLLKPDEGGALESMGVGPFPARPLASREVRVAVDAAGLNFWDVFRSLALIDEGLLGGEFCGRVLEVGTDVTAVSVGDRVVGLAFGTFGPEAIMVEEMVAPAPEGYSVAELATMPTAFVSAALSYDIADLKAGERVLIHAGAGGVGLAAIQLAQTLGAEVYATASAPKQAYLRSIGVEHVFDSRQTDFGQQILDATGGQGVHVVLNNLTGEGFIEASLSCLAQGGRFVELARVGILSTEEMATARPDVAYTILELDTLKEHDPAQPGDALRRVMQQLADGALTPLIHSRWSLTEAGPAMDYMRAARHIGKIVLTTSPLETGQLREDRTYLVTGGLGGIGCALAGWLAERGAGAIVLNGRRDPDPEAEQAIDALRRRGVEIRVELADVTDAAAVEAMLARIDESLPPLAGIIHSVGVLSDAALTNQTWEGFEDVLWPKVLGAWHLHRATLDRDLDLFVLFSSITGVLGNAGQANHGAANAFLDQLAGHRRALGLAGQSIAWGAWAGLGEAEEQRDRISRQLEAAGTGWMTPQQGLRSLESLMRQDVTAGMVAAVDWQVFAQNHEHKPLLLEDLLSAAADGEEQQAELPQDLMSRLQDAAIAEREQILVTFLQQEIQSVMRLPTEPAPTADFSDLGMDSLMAVELRNRINRGFAGEYVASNTVVFDYPNIAGLARHLASELGDDQEPETLPESAAAEQPPPSETEQAGIAIVGMACRFPGAEDLSAFWDLLETGRNSVTDGRQDSGPWSGIAGDPDAEDAAYRRGAFLEGIDHFDSRFFKISPIEARMMDPQQRLLLETSWQALEDAGIDPDGLRGSRTGVYAGVGGSEYRRIITASGQDDDYLGTAGGVAVGRIAFTLGLEGPAVPLELACAASLVAVHQAATSLQRGEVDLALAGGVNVVLSLGVMRFLADAGMLSMSGQCWTFDEAADGYVRGEGCGMLVLKRLRDAEADGDRIWGVVRGTAVNQNGAGLGLSLPNGPAQERAMEDALAQAGVKSNDVDYLEAHGPGTALGDAIELNAVANVYGKGRDESRPLLIGSVKTNIAHLEAAGGVASLIKTVLALNRGVIPRHLNLNTPNPDIDWDRLPVRVTQEQTPWPLVSDRRRLASVNVFGITGANAHVVLENYTAPGANEAEMANGTWPAGALQVCSLSLPEDFGVTTRSEITQDRTARLLPLSGKTNQALRELAARYLGCLDEYAGQPDAADGISHSQLSDMAWTAGVGRSHFAFRAGIVFHGAQDLREKLTELAASEEGLDRPESQAPTKIAFLYTGEVGTRFGLAKTLYEQEPVVRAVLDRCDAVLKEQRETSLLGVILGQSGDAADLNDPIWSQPASYALECALAALWASVGVRPDVVVGQGAGELAAAQVAGAFSLEDGLRLAAARGAALAAPPTGGEVFHLKDAEPLLPDFSAAPLSLPLLNGATGKVVAAADLLNQANLEHESPRSLIAKSCAIALAELGVDAVVAIGPQTLTGEEMQDLWPVITDLENSAPAPVMIEYTQEQPADGSPEGPACGFLKAVAIAYEAGFTISHAGLFAGESRRRVALPGYPFQRRRHWVELSKRLVST